MIRVLGTWLGADREACVKKMWEEQLLGVQRLLSLWGLRGTGVKGNAILVNGIIIPKLVYVMRVCQTPREVLIKLHEMITNFLWKRSNFHVARNTLVGRKEHWGLQLCDLEVKEFSLRMGLFQKFLIGEKGHIWGDYFRDFVDQGGMCGLFNLCSQFFVRRTKGRDPFFEEMAEAWTKALPN